MEMIPDWAVIGPFAPDADTAGVAPAHTVPDFAKTHVGRDGRPVGWAAAFADDSAEVDFGDAAAVADFSVYYATAEITAYDEVEAVLRVGHDDGATLWLNGSKIHEQQKGSGMFRTRQAGPSFEVRARLSAGTNRLVFRVFNEWAGAGVGVRIAGIDGKPIPGLTAGFPTGFPAAAPELPLLRTLPSSSRVTLTAFSPDGRWLAAAHAESGASLWDMQAGPADKPVRLLPTAGPVESLDFSPDSSVVAVGGRDRVVRVWDTRDGRGLFTSPPEAGAVTRVRFSPDGTLLAVRSAPAGEGPGVLRLWDNAWTAREVAPRVERTENLDLDWSPDGTLWVLTGNYGMHRIGPDGAVLEDRWLNINGYNLHANAIRFSPGGATLATTRGYDGALRLYNGGLRVQTTGTHRVHGMARMAFSPDGRLLASTGRAGDAKVWDVVTGKERAILTGGREGPLSGPAFSPDGKWLAVGAPDGVRLWAGPAADRRLLPGADAGWLRKVRGYPPEELARAVGDKLAELNPGFDGKVEREIADGRVVKLAVAAKFVSDLSPLKALRDLQMLKLVGRRPGPADRLATALTGLPLKQLTTDAISEAETAALRKALPRLEVAVLK